MVVHDSFWSVVFPENSSRGSAAASEIRVYIHDDNHDKENIEDQDNTIGNIASKESVNSQELKETPQNKEVYP